MLAAQRVASYEPTLAPRVISPKIRNCLALHCAGQLLHNAQFHLTLWNRHQRRQWWRRSR